MSETPSQPTQPPAPQPPPPPPPPGGQLASVEVEARVLRADGTVEELGRVAYWHRNPLRRLLGKMRQRGGPLAGGVRVGR